MTPEEREVYCNLISGFEKVVLEQCKDGAVLCRVMDLLDEIEVKVLMAVRGKG